MTTAEAHRIAQTNPVRTLTAKLGEQKEEADTLIARLTAKLKDLDLTRDQLNEHGLSMTVDLGAIGNAAAHARRAELTDKGRDVFELPKDRVA